MNSKQAMLFGDDEFYFLRDKVKECTGINLTEAKRDLVYSRLSKRLRNLGLSNFVDYCNFLDTQEDEISELTNAITTNLTSFFRESHHFDFLKQKLLPELFKKYSADRRLRIWSAGCSSGEEPYTLAITVKESLPSGSTWDARILATDIDTNILASARNGIYKNEKLTGISDHRKKKWFKKGSADHQNMMRVSPDIQALVTFKQLNLMGAWPMKGPFDFIFCRNVVIYFDKPTQKVLFNRYVDLLKDGGHLFLGHSESLFKVSDRFELLGQTIYRKIK